MILMNFFGYWCQVLKLLKRKNEFLEWIIENGRIRE